MPLVGLIIRVYHDTRSSECQIHTREEFFVYISTHEDETTSLSQNVGNQIPGAEVAPHSKRTVPPSTSSCLPPVCLRQPLVRKSAIVRRAQFSC